MPKDVPETIEVTKLRPLDRAFYERSTADVARDLLGKLLVRAHSEGVTILRLTEVEAYLGVDDRACHTFGGRRTRRNEVMWGPAGHLYVYFTYGMHHCANVVTRSAEEPEAVLLRGGVAVQGMEIIVARRGERRHGLTDGPAKLCQGMAIDRALNGVDVTSRRGGLWIADDGVRCHAGDIQASPRIGVAYAGDAASWPLRFTHRRA